MIKYCSKSSEKFIPVSLGLIHFSLQWFVFALASRKPHILSKIMSLQTKKPERIAAR
jgi:hypothetical protein